MKLGLKNMELLARAVGSPQDGLHFLHIAGTNGKGSTASFLASALRAAGYRVGLYTSPHLCTIRERIQIDGAITSKWEFTRWIRKLQAAIRNLEETQPGFAPTFFEVLTAAALLAFRDAEVDWVVWETGLGGRLDATNIVRPEACVITTIGLEHTHHLGSSLAEIAWEKAGILKPGIPAVVGDVQEEARETIRRRADQIGTPLLEVGGLVEESCAGGDLHQGARIGGQRLILGLLGRHQVSNAACAYALLRLPLFSGKPLPQKAIRAGFRSVRWPGRFEVLQQDPLWILDGAHNPQAAEALLETWRSSFGTQPYHLVFAVLTDKDFAAVAGTLARQAERVSLVKLSTERGLDPCRLIGFFPGIPCQAYRCWGEARRALEKDPGPLLVTGSLFLVGEVLADHWGLHPEFESNELLEPPRVYSDGPF
ncbi:dihydrofolate synthase / folylpolyglutamate synthase [Methylacidimicrobium cyclopophantes]|uniref:Dihydrofolate synthase/folylpolyglutamate synthase n=1 Tax=Methylacidimicrobium cyclopophantes TaxID=1041766 RepID=A0A5E6MJI4_9BACT|nr:folylpolyglutamate synthase/dihydrofolate synthase family protein [Methylacidimicrobium cyclopophantes]VVM08490.1 dihydrofolate synthase / folylpolyglutamate synthase [Methylacidimicrobium cyclopophantes]